MRQKRAKAYRKLMTLYSTTFGFRQPYQVLVDSKMCKSATDLKIELIKQIGIVLQGDIKPMITQCSIHELYLQGKSQQPAVDLAKLFERRKCNHREPIPGDDCVSSVVGDANKHRYVIATQSQPLRVKLRNVPAVPIVHINRTVMVLEPPSDVTIQVKESTEEKALHPAALDLALVATSSSVEPIRKQKKGPKAPNPLSIKKKASTVLAKEKGYGIRAQSKEDNARSGGKRKRDVDEDSESRPQNFSMGNSTQETPAKKRRWRRKAVATSSSMGESADA